MSGMGTRVNMCVLLVEAPVIQKVTVFSQIQVSTPKSPLNGLDIGLLCRKTTHCAGLYVTAPGVGASMLGDLATPVGHIKTIHDTFVCVLFA